MSSVHPEALLISAIVRTGEHKVLAAQGITSDMFTVHTHEAEFIEKYVLRYGKAPSKITLKQSFPDFTVYKVSDPEHWCEEVRAEFKRQSLVNLFDGALNHLDNPGGEAAALDMIQTGLVDISVRSAGASKDFDIFEDWEEVYSGVARRVEKVRDTGFAGIPTGFKTLDDLTGGLQEGWLGIVAARLGQGKTWTGIRMAYAAALSGHSVTYFSLEQSRFQIAMRMHAFGSRQYGKEVVNPMDLNRGKGFDLRAYGKFLEKMRDERGKGQFYVNDTSRGQVSPQTIAQVIESRMPDVVYVDYLTLLQTKGDDWRATAALSSALQTTGQRYGVPIIALSQINRLGISAKTPPGAEHLSQADAIGQDADFVLTQMQRSRSVMMMRLAKFRHGLGGDTWYAKFSPGTGEYEEITSAEAEKGIEADDEDLD